AGRGDVAVQAQVHAKGQFPHGVASGESVFGVQTNTARKTLRSDHTEGRLITAPSGSCVRKGTPNGNAAAPVGAFPTVSRQTHPVTISGSGRQPEHRREPSPST